MHRLWEALGLENQWILQNTFFHIFKCEFVLRLYKDLSLTGTAVFSTYTLFYCCHQHLHNVLLMSSAPTHCSHVISSY